MKFHPVFQNSLVTASVIGLSLLVSTPADAITYTLDRTIVGNNGEVRATAIGSIITDGTLGLLSASNFVDWNIELKQFNFFGNLIASIVLTPSNSVAEYFTVVASSPAGNIQLTATSSGLIAEEVGPSTNPFTIFRIRTNSIPFNNYTLSGLDSSGVPGFPPFFCSPAQLDTTDCLTEGISINGSGDVNYFSDTPNGLTIATASTPTNVPEPSSVVSLLSLGALAAIGLGKKKA